jgi:hypothetical protein
VTDRFQNGRRHFENSSECYKVGNYHPILTKIGTQTKKNMPSSKIAQAEVYTNFQDGRRRHVGISNASCKVGNYHQFSPKSVVIAHFIACT